MNHYAIIVAGGSGNRMNNTIPKQFLILDGKPVLMHSIERFQHCGLNVQIIVVLPTVLTDTWHQLCEHHDFTIPHRIVSSGTERFHSVKNGLSAITGEGLVAIHDAARPLASSNLITHSFDMAARYGSAVAMVNTTDSIRRRNPDQTTTALQRRELFAVQTPQTFSTELLRKAYQIEYETAFTDDASVLENAGYTIHAIDGERTNIKITYPEDLLFADLFIKKQKLS